MRGGGNSDLGNGLNFFFILSAFMAFNYKEEKALCEFRSFSKEEGGLVSLTDIGIVLVL